MKVYELKEYNGYIIGIDWVFKSDCIVICGVDCNVYVWSQKDGIWKFILVILRINCVVIFVKWFLFENKFVVGSGVWFIFVCYFEFENDWWVSKYIKKLICFIVFSLDWYFNNVLLVVGFCDFKCRVFFVYIKEVDEKLVSMFWGSKMFFGQLMFEFGGSGIGGWVYGVSFFVSGNCLVWVSYDSIVFVVDVLKSVQVLILRIEFLLLFSVLFVLENSVVVVGYDCCLMFFNYDDCGCLIFVFKLDVLKQSIQCNMFVMECFCNMDKRVIIEDCNIVLEILYQNSII